jgi:hypothetical protein
MALANATNGNENQITSGYCWWVSVVTTKGMDPVSGTEDRHNLHGL